MAGPVRILVVEDEAFVALDLALQLEDRGFACLSPVPSVAQALQVLAVDSPDFVILDANLNGERPVAVAELLHARGIPFAYVSGYGADVIASQMPVAPLVPKPVCIDDLVREITVGLDAATSD